MIDALRNWCSAVLLGLTVCCASGRADLVQYWAFDDGATNSASTTAANAIAGGNTGILNNFNNIGTLNMTGGWVTTGLPVPHSTAALDFDPPANDTSGDSGILEDYVDGGDIDIDIPVFGSGEVTVSLWVKPRNQKHDRRFWSQLANGDHFAGDGGGARVRKVGEGPPLVNVFVGAPNGNDVTFPGVDEMGVELPETEWSHLAFVWQGSNSTLYWNGVAQGTAELSPFSFNNSKNFGIGAKFGNTTGGRFGLGYSGLMDDVAIWNEALSPELIANLALGASPLDPSNPPMGVLGDYNGDGTVDAADYVVWRKGGPLQNEGASPGVVDQADYDFWRSRFGNTSGSGSGSGSSLSAIPEPSAAVLLGLGTLCVFLTRIEHGRKRRSH